MLDNSILVLSLIFCKEVGNILDTPSNLSLKILKEMFKFNSNYLRNILMSLDVLHRNSNIGVSQSFPDPCIKGSMTKNIYQEDIFLRMQRVEGKGLRQARDFIVGSRAAFLLRRLKQ